MRSLGEHPDGGVMDILDGRYGHAYIKFGKLNVTIPKDEDPMTISVARGLELIAERQKKGPTKRKRKKG